MKFHYNKHTLSYYFVYVLDSIQKRTVPLLLQSFINYYIYSINKISSVCLENEDNNEFKIYTFEKECLFWKLTNLLIYFDICDNNDS